MVGGRYQCPYWQPDKDKYNVQLLEDLYTMNDHVEPFNLHTCYECSVLGLTTDETSLTLSLTLSQVLTFQQQLEECNAPWKTLTTTEIEVRVIDD